MITPKPMSKERRAEISDYIGPSIGETPSLLDELLAAEAYWREAVSAHGCSEESDILASVFCGWCSAKNDEPHDGGCLWLLAQD